MKYTQVGHATSSKSCENNSVLSVKSAVKRKVETAKGIQWNSFRRSPVNALSDALYSDHYSSCSSEIPGRTGLHNTPLTSAQVFHLLINTSAIDDNASSSTERMKQLDEKR